MIDQILLVNLDSLMDTRAGTLSKLDPSYIKKVASKEYREREEDDWDSIFEEEGLNERFKELYAKRDIGTLKASICTDIVYMINELTNEWQQLLINSPTVESISLHINQYPYKLSEAEKEMFVRVMTTYVSVDTRIKIVDIPTKELTAKYIDELYSVVILYDIDEWLWAHYKELEKTKIPSVTFIVPSIYRNKKPTQEELEKEGGKDVDPFVALEFVLAETLGLTVVPTHNFCAIKP